MGADGVEFDVQLSSDGLPVVIHDARVNRTTDGAGPVAHFTADQLAEFDAGRWFEQRLARKPRTRAMAERVTPGGVRSFSGEGVPTLEAALALLAPARLARVYIELKSRPANRLAMVEATLELIRAFSMEQSAILLSFDHEALTLAKRMAPDIRVAANYPTAGRRLATARHIIASAEQIAADEVGLHYSLATQRAVAALRESGYAVSAWTANSKIVMRRLISRGVDSIMTNFPNRLIEVIESPPRQSRVARLRRRRN